MTPGSWHPWQVGILTSLPIASPSLEGNHASLHSLRRADRHVRECGRRAGDHTDWFFKQSTFVGRMSCYLHLTENFSIAAIVRYSPGITGRSGTSRTPSASVMALMGLPRLQALSVISEAAAVCCEADGALTLASKMMETSKS